MSINEEVSRIKEVMGLLNEQSVNKDKIFNSLNKLKWWLYDKNGLGLQKIIESKLSTIVSPINQIKIKKFTDGAKTLKDAGKITDKEYDNFVVNLPNKSQVFTNKNGEIDANGEWNPVNKLNTNYSDIADLLTTLLISSKENGNIISNDIINTINENGDVKDVLLKNKVNIFTLFDEYIKSPKEMLKFTKNTIRNSKYGETIETNVADKLSNLGYEILYRGGDGDYIDMVFSIDMIVRSTKSGVRTIQVKSNKEQSDKFIDGFNNGKYSAVDLLIYPLDSDYIIHSLRFNKTKKIPIDSSVSKLFK